MVTQNSVTQKLTQRDAQTRALMVTQKQRDAKTRALMVTTGRPAGTSYLHRFGMCHYATYLGIRAPLKGVPH